MAASTSSNLDHRTSQVFINFRGAELRHSFISHLESALVRNEIYPFIDKYQNPGEKLQNLFKRIEESSIAIAVISSRYTESEWCLNELAKITERVENKLMEVLPVFYKVIPARLRDYNGTFGDNLRNTLKLHPDKKETWEKALTFVSWRSGTTVDDMSEATKLDEIVEGVLKILAVSTKRTEGREGTQDKFMKVKGEQDKTCSDTSSLYGMETRTKQLEDKLQIKSNVTRIVGVVGMPGIGKTTLAKKVLEKQRGQFMYTVYLDAKCHLLKRLHEDLLLELYSGKNNERKQPMIDFSVHAFEAVLSKKKTFVVLDDVTEKRQLDEILGNREWICEGSKVVIITRSESAVKGIVNDCYFVPGLSHSYALSLFNYHAFSSADYCGDPCLMKLAGEFVDYSEGHPLALKVLGGELHLKEKTYWESKRGMLTTGMSNPIQNSLRVPYDELSEHHKNVFLDIACFFRFDNEYYVKSLLDSSHHDDIRVLADKFLINICAGRLRMNDLLYTFAMGLVSQASENTRSGCRIFNHGDIVGLLSTKTEETKVRGIFFDVSQATGHVKLDNDIFAKMGDIRYLKFYNSRCPEECKSVYKVKIPDKVEFTLQEIRFLHWLKFPLEKFPQDFDPRNLIDLKLPYSKMEQIWEGEKDASKLKWLDLKHSRKLRTLSGLSQAKNLQTINLEGCTELKTVHEEVKNMNSLLFLNLRGCTSLESLPEMNLVSLKTLILSGCSSFEVFHMVGNNIEELYLDGTAIKGLPPTIGDFQSLVFLNLKDCKYLSSLPDTVGNLQALEKLILSGCSSLEILPNVQQTLKYLKTLELDQTRIYSSQLHRETCELPSGSFLSSSVRRLCLSRNSFKSLPSDISLLHHLTWLDLKYCKELSSIPVLPPNLEWLNAHGCISLEKVADPSPLSLAETKHIYSTFNFSNCTKLDQVAENSIETYVWRNILLMSNAVARYNEGFVLDVSIRICYPGWQVPRWFNHRTVGSVLKPELSMHWGDGEIIGIALCAVVSFANYQTQNSRLFVRCTCEFTEKDGSCIRFTCILGDCNEHGSDEPMKIESGHVFIGYMSWLHIKKCNVEIDNRNGCVATEASVKVEVTDGKRQVRNCEVLKCGFSLIYAPTEVDRSCSPEVYSGVPDTIHGDNGGNIQKKERDHVNGIEIREEGGSETDNDATPSRSNGGIGNEMECKERSSSGVDTNVTRISTPEIAEKKKPIGVSNSTGGPYIGNKVNRKTYLTCLDGIFHCLWRSKAEENP